MHLKEAEKQHHKKKPVPLKLSQQKEVAPRGGGSGTSGTTEEEALSMLDFARNAENFIVVIEVRVITSKVLKGARRT